MPNQQNQFVRMLFTALAFCCLLPLLTGCANCRLPQIDPSGDRIFLPSPNYTTLESCLPKPAFTTPAQPPKCAPPPVAAAPQVGQPQGVIPVAASAPLPPGRNMLKLTPGRVVAPVGSEVVLVAGYCGGDGRFVMKAPVEWTLSQESVGHFVDIAQPSREYLAALMHESPKKLSANYAITHTISTNKVITRGTANQQDDVAVKEGQTWISVTSPTEGNSHVTVLAPKAEGWDQRRQTATIHWIDAQWVLPPPSVLRAGQQHLLSTAVQRATNGSPLTGWSVRYEIVGGVPATFPNGQSSIEVQTDAAGRANVALTPARPDAGQTQIAIHIERPASASGELPRTPVGQGWTTINWSAATLGVQVTGPDTVEVENIATYQIQVANNGDLTASDVIVSTNTPPNLEFVGSDPPAQFFTGQLQWQLGDLHAHTIRPITVQMRAKRGGDVQFCAVAQSRADESVRGQGCKDRTRVYAPALSLNIVGPTTAEVGQEVRFELNITNRGDVPLTNVTLTNRFDPGLRHVLGEVSPIRRVLGTLAPGETQVAPVTFIPQQPGQLCHILEATADGGQASASRACVMATMPNRPSAGVPGSGTSDGVQAKIVGPVQYRVGGQPPIYRLTVTNQRPASIRNVSIICTFDDSLEPNTATAGHVQALPGQIVWSVPEIRPGQSEDRAIDFRLVRPVRSASVRLVVTSAPDNIYATDQLVTEIIDPNLGGGTAPREFNPNGAGAVPPAGAAQSGQLRLTITDNASAVRMGDRNVYIIKVHNDRNTTDRDVVLTVRMPPEIDIRSTRIEGPTVQPRFPDARTVEFSPIQEMRDNEVITFKIETVMPQRPGRITVQAMVRSQRSPAPIEASRETEVVAQ